MANPYIERATIEDEVRAALATTLRHDAGAIDLESSIVTDLGATSIDFLDINFRLENAFGVQLATQLLLDHVEEELGEGKAIDRDGKVTAPAAELLKLYLGDLPGLEAGMYADEISTAVTPNVVADGVVRVLDTLPDACTHCSASAWQSDDGAQVKCGSCGKDAAYPNGDDLTKRWIHEVEGEKHLFANA